MSSSDCVDEELVLAFIGGALPTARAEAVRRHIDECRSCHDFVSTVVEVESTRDRFGAPPDDALSAAIETPGSPRYQLLELVGAGAAGVVYRAQDAKLRRVVALKLLHVKAAPDRHLAEAQAMARLAHPNVVTVHDVGTLAGRVFIAMEYIAGKTLATLLRERRLEWTAARDLMLEAGRGLAAAHAAGLVHGDFKPQNVLIGDDGRVRVTDFGLAAEPGESQPGLVGTPAYMAPEQLQGRPADQKSDQFSFCASLYEAIHGERPFPGTTLAELKENVLAGRLRPVQRRLPSSVREALLRGLRHDPAERHASIEALLAALSQTRTSLPWAWMGLAAALAVALVAAPPLTRWASRLHLPRTELEMPEGALGIGFDDLGFAPRLGRVLIPSGRTGRLNLIDPERLAVTSIGGFARSGHLDVGHGVGTTSADEAGAVLVAIDRTALKLSVVDPKTLAPFAEIPLGGGPDYVRFVPFTHEVWVTEPDEERIEVFGLSEAPPYFARLAALPLPGGPESLVIDPTRRKAYTHLWTGKTAVIDIGQRRVERLIANGCLSSRGIALDVAKDWLFVGCDEGKATVLDLGHDGQVLSSLPVGRGVDIISYDPVLRHLYLPSATTGTLSIAAVSSSGQLSSLGEIETAVGAHCVTHDDRAQVWVCDPNRGRLIMFQDTLAAAPR